LADAPSAHKHCPDQSSFNYEIVEGWYPGAEDSIASWRRDQVIQPAAYTLGDYNFEKPALDLTANQTGNGSGNWEIYDYPGEYDSKSEGDTYANIRLEEQESPGVVITGAGTGRSFATGFKFDLKEHYRASENATYVLTSVNHSAYEGGTYPGLNGGAEQATYSNTFTCIPFAIPFRPPRVTPRPQMQGSQTAFVVGPSGEEIYVDKYGRVKVQFHWDRRGKNDENSSCWIRVSHLWAGKGWGAVFTPRIGQEVIVDFLEGDPDQPIITGRVYNATAVVPYTLPDEQTKSTLKSYSSKGGGGFNEFRFEDKKGSEQIFIHAEKDQHDRIKNDRYEIVGNDSHLIVTKDQMEQVKGDKHLQVKGDQNEKVDGSVSLKAGQDLQQKVGMKMALDAGQEIHLKAGMNLVVESGTNLTLKVGGNFININPGGIFIKGTMVMLNSGGSAGSGAGSNPAVPKDPKEADKAEPGSALAPPASKAPPTPFKYSPQAIVLKHAAQSGVPFCDI
jgi:type VI secretion system secreted protein VgrG